MSRTLQAKHDEDELHSSCYCRRGVCYVVGNMISSVMYPRKCSSVQEVWCSSQKVFRLLWHPVQGI